MKENVKKYGNLVYFSDDFLKENINLFLVLFVEDSPSYLDKINNKKPEIMSISTQWDFDTFMKYRDFKFYHKNYIKIFYNGEFYSYLAAYSYPPDFEYNFCKICKNYLPLP